MLSNKTETDLLVSNHFVLMVDIRSSFSGSTCTLSGGQCPPSTFILNAPPYNYESTRKSLGN